MEVSINGGIPGDTHNGEFLMEIPINMDDDRGYPHCSKAPYGLFWGLLMTFGGEHPTTIVELHQATSGFDHPKAHLHGWDRPVSSPPKWPQWR